MTLISFHRSPKILEAPSLIRRLPTPAETVILLDQNLLAARQRALAAHDSRMYCPPLLEYCSGAYVERRVGGVVVDTILELSLGDAATNFDGQELFDALAPLRRPGDPWTFPPLRRGERERIMRLPQTPDVPATVGEMLIQGLSATHELFLPLAREAVLATRLAFADIAVAQTVHPAA